MERNLQMNLHVSKRPATKRVNKLFIILILAGIFLILAIFAGKIRENLRKPSNSYDIHSSKFGLIEKSDNTFATSFAQNLCVVDDDIALKSVNMKDTKSAFLFSINDKEVIYSKNAHKKVYPASLTKIMTALVVLEHAQLDDEVKISDEAIKNLPSGSSVCNIKAGDVLTVDQLLYGMLLPSGGDAAMALSLYISDSTDEFCKLMNEKAKKIGATNTNFVNPHGFFNKNHYTTAYDMYLIFNEAIKNKDFVRIISTPTFICNYTDKSKKASQSVFNNTNQYLSGYHKAPKEVLVIGGKTGYTSDAGRCLILLSYDIDKNPYISAIFKSKDPITLYNRMDNLLKEID